MATNAYTYNREELREYLLGRLTGERRMALERAWFVSEEVDGALRAAEEELFDEYARGLLPPGDRRSFEQRLASSFVWQEKADFERTLLQTMRQPEQSWQSSRRLYHAIAEYISRLFVAPAVRWGVGVALVAVTLLAGRTWWLRSHDDGQMLAAVDFVVDTDIPGIRGGSIAIGTRGVPSPEQVPEARVITGTDQYALRLAPRTSLYLYVVQWDTAGNVTALFPNPAVTEITNPARPDSLFRVPPAPGWFAVDKDPGVETVGILASSEEWPEADEQLRLIRTGAYPEKMAALRAFRALMAAAEEDQNDGATAREFSFILRK